MEDLCKKQKPRNATSLTVKQPFLVLSKLRILSENKIRVNFPLIIYIVSVTTIISIALQQLATAGDISGFVCNLEVISSFGMVLAKAVAIKYKRQDFINLLDKTKQFWDPDKWQQINSISNTVFYLQKIYVGFLISSAILISATSFFEDTSPVGTWYPRERDKYVFYSFILIPVLIMISAVVTCVVDCIFLAFCGEIVMQFRIIRKSLEESVSSENDALENFKVCIRHHNLVLRFIKKLQNAFSAVCLIQCLTGSLICAELYAAFESHSLERRVRHTVTFVFIILQLCFYCIPISYIEDEALAISEAAYFPNCNFHHLPSLKVPILLIIQNSQNRIIIKAGGLIDMKISTVLNVLKMVWSICSIMRGLNKTES